MNTLHLRWFRLLLAGLAIIAALLLVQSPWGQRVNALLLDTFTRWQVDTAAPDDIVIVDIDDASLQQIAPWPWPRSLMAALITRLYANHRLKGLALDMVFPESKTPAGDQRLAQVVKEKGVCIAQAFDTGASHRKVGALAAPTPLSVLHPLSATGYVGNYPALAHAARCSGHITPHSDADGVVRRMPSGFHYGGKTWPWLAGALAAAARSQPVAEPMQPIPFRHAVQSWRAVPAHLILTGQLPPHALDGAWVLVGSTALGLNDAVVTPLNTWTPGIVLHAELLDSRLRPLPTAVAALTVWPWLVAGLIVIWIQQTLQRGWLAAGALGLVVLNGLWLAAAAVLWQARQDFDAIAPFWMTVLALLIMLPFEWRWVLRRHWRLARLFRGYLAPAVVERLLREDERTGDVLAPKRRDITVMFADIEGFTQLSRAYPADELARLTREVLALLTDQVHRFEGTLDKYIGDAVMALWNAPLDQPDHADRAMQCAFSMVAALEQWNRAHPEWPDIRIHIAINSGEAMVGDLGTALRHTYTAIGHTVNQADRMLACARDAGQSIVIAETTAARLHQEYAPHAYCICRAGVGCQPPGDQQRLF